MESAKQEKSNLLKDNPVAKVASGGSWMSKHVSPISMGGEKGSGAYMNNMAPKMHGALHMGKGAPTLQKDEDFKGKKPMVKGPGGKMVPAYAVDGKGKS